MLKEMYKQIPKSLLINKWDLSFIVSKQIYNKEKHLIHNKRFLGINIKVLHNDLLNENACGIGFDK